MLVETAITEKPEYVYGNEAVITRLFATGFMNEMA